MKTVYVVMKTIYSFDGSTPEETRVETVFADEDAAEAYVEKLEKKAEKLSRLAEEIGALLACPSYEVVEADVEGTEATIEDEDDYDAFDDEDDDYI